MGIELQNQQALRLWRRALAETVRLDEPDLTARQLAILLTVYLEPPPHTVRGLAADLKIAKPVVTRALDRLTTRQLVERQRDRADGRSILVERTMAGIKFLNRLADVIIDAGRGE